MEDMELAIFIGWGVFLVLLVSIWRTGGVIYDELRDQTSELQDIRRLLEDQAPRRSDPLV